MSRQFQTCPVLQIMARKLLGLWLWASCWARRRPAANAIEAESDAVRAIIAQVECCLLIGSGDSKGLWHGDLRMVFRSDVAKSVASKLSRPSGWANLFLELLDIVTVRFPKSFASGALESVIQREQIPQLENAHMEGWWVIRALPMLKICCPMLPCLPAANVCRSLAQHCTIPAKSANLSQCTHPSTCNKLQQSHGLCCLWNPL